MIETCIAIVTEKNGGDDGTRTRGLCRRQRTSGSYLIDNSRRGWLPKTVLAYSETITG
jgi:hypothetical protein